MFRPSVRVYLFGMICLTFSDRVDADQPFAGIQPIVRKESGAAILEYSCGDRLLTRFRSDSPLGVKVLIPGGDAVSLNGSGFTTEGKKWIFAPVEHGALSLQLIVEQKNSALIEQRVEVTARQSQKFTLKFSLSPVGAGEYASFGSVESAPVIYDTRGGGPEYPDLRGQTFPVAMFRQAGEVFGIIADSPGRWENRCHVEIDPQAGQLGVMTGDASDPRELVIRFDARDKYRYQLDGWQKIEPGETRSFSTWVFLSPAANHFQSQLAAHLALANAKGWNHSSTEAILRNTSCLLLRRNLMRDEGRYLFISGIGYGWKQWVSDGFYTALGLDDPETMIESCRSVFSNRITYAENPQYYLIWSVLLKRAGGVPNLPLVNEAFEFIRRHEKEGVYYPPSLAGAPHPKGWKTYMDILQYDHDDAPASNQGFHCGAILAAQELGLPVTEEDVQRSIQGYRSMFNEKLGFMPTSLKQQEILGQDTLYGATLTFAVFGRKLLTDEQVLAHHRTSLRTMSPYGLRVISRADGGLLPDHNGSYVYGGSWFLCDAGNFMLAGVHGLPESEVNHLISERIKLELAHVPAFNESISTVTGQPHGHILYSWNSGYWWLRKEIRRRLGQPEADPVDESIDRHLHVIRREGALEIDRNSLE